MNDVGLQKRLKNLRPYKTGENRHTRRAALLAQLNDTTAAILERLRAEYDPEGTLSGIAVDRLKLAARHFAVAQIAGDPTMSVRSTRTAEMLLNRLHKPKVRHTRDMRDINRELTHAR